MGEAALNTLLMAREAIQEAQRRPLQVHLREEGEGEEEEDASSSCPARIQVAVDIIMTAAALGRGPYCCYSPNDPLPLKGSALPPAGLASPGPIKVTLCGFSVNPRRSSGVGDVLWQQKGLEFLRIMRQGNPLPVPSLGSLCSLEMIDEGVAATLGPHFQLEACFTPILPKHLSYSTSEEDGLTRLILAV